MSDEHKGEQGHNDQDETTTRVSPPEYTDEHGLPRILTREEYEAFGDDPDPLPEGFEVIDGGPGTSKTLHTQTAPTTTNNKDAAKAVQDQAAVKPIKQGADNLTDTPSPESTSLGALFSQGAGALRQVSVAKRAYTEARNRLQELDARLDQLTHELDHRQEIAQNYESIVAEQQERRSASRREADKAAKEQGLIAAHIQAMRADLDRMKEEDQTNERVLKSTLEAAEAREASEREVANRIRRRLDDAKRRLETAEQAHEVSLETATRAVEAAQSRLESLRSEYAELQRTPSANPASYSVRESELAAQISDATEALRDAQSSVPRIRKEVDSELKHAQEALAEAERPVEEAKRNFQTIASKTLEARDALDAAREQATTRQKQQRDAIREQERERRELERAEQQARDDAQHAQDLITEADEIRATPEITLRIAEELKATRADRAELAGEVEHLGRAVEQIRERTRGPRMKLAALSAAAALVIIAVIIVALLLN